MRGVHVTYRPLPTATPGQERAALASIFKLVLDTHAKKKAAAGSGGKDGERKDQHALTEAQYTG